MIAPDPEPPVASRTPRPPAAGGDAYFVDAEDVIIETGDDGSIDIIDARGSFDVGNAQSK